MLVSLLDDTPGLLPLGEDPREEWNWFAPLLRIGLARPREFSAHLTALGVHNSVGSHGLTAADRRLLFARYMRDPCLRARTAIDSLAAKLLAQAGEQWQRLRDSKIHWYAPIVPRGSIVLFSGGVVHGTYLPKAWTRPRYSLDMRVVGVAKP